MNALLDAMGATVIGAMFMLTILSSMFNIQAISQNANLQMQIIDRTERVTSVLDYHYLEAVGAGISSGAIISSATATNFTFFGELEGSMRKIRLVRRNFDNTRNAYAIEVEIDDVAQFGPFWASNSNDGTLSGMNIRYFNQNNAVISYGALATQSQRDLIRSISVELELVFDTYRRDLRAVDNKHRITFWKHFPNLYL